MTTNHTPMQIARDLMDRDHSLTVRQATEQAYRMAFDVQVRRVAELEAALRAMADLAHTTTRPSGEPALCRALLDIEGIARAAIAKGQS